MLSVRLRVPFIVVMVVLQTFSANVRIIEDKRRKPQRLLKFQSNGGFLNSLASLWKKNICFHVVDFRCHGNRS